MTRAEILADDPIWLILIKVIIVLLLGPIMTIFLIVWERKAIGRMQQRPGPNRVGPGGYLQSIADAIKLPFKEQIIPASADRKVYFLAPVLVVIPAIMAFSVLPFGPQVSIFGEQTYLQLVDLPVGVLVVLACSSVGIYGIVLAGWSSGSPYPLLGGLRSAAQMISYEIAMGLSIVAVVLYTGSLSTGHIVDAQQGGWYFYLLIPSFLIYLVSMVGETNRAPFDLPEAESELVGGFHTEYSSMRFAMFFMAEYMNMITVSALATTLFLGGFHAPLPFNLVPGLDSGWWGLLWFLLKVLVMLFVFVWLRGTLPRLRYDQFMRFGWRWLIPVSLAWIVLVATFRVGRRDGWFSTPAFWVVAAVVFVVLLAASFLGGQEEEKPAAVPPGEFDAFAGGYPVPPTKGQELPELAQVLPGDAERSSTTAPPERGEA